MSKKSISEIAKKMAAIDVAILSTHTTGGQIAARPMSNNGEVEYDGDSYYFTWEKSRMVADIKRDSKVSLAFQGKNGFWLIVEGVGEVVRDKDEFVKHWNPDIEKWFEEGVDTDGLVMLKIGATRGYYWDGQDEGEIKF